MGYVELPDHYTSWVKLAQQADELLIKLRQHNKYIHIGEEAPDIKNILFFDISDSVEE